MVLVADEEEEEEEAEKEAPTTTALLVCCGPLRRRKLSFLHACNRAWLRATRSTYEDIVRVRMTGLGLG